MAANGIVWSRGCIGGAKVLACVTFEVSVLVTLLLRCHFSFSLGGTLWVLPCWVLLPCQNDTSSFKSFHVKGEVKLMPESQLTRAERSDFQMSERLCLTSISIDPQ